MTPVSALLRFHWRLLGGYWIPALVAALAAAILVVPREWDATWAWLGYFIAVAVPWSSWAKPSTAERCLPIAWATLRRARAAAHLAIASTAILPLAALVASHRGGADADDQSILALALLIPCWPALSVLGAPLAWRVGAAGGVVFFALGATALTLVSWLAVLSTSSAVALTAAASVGLVSLIVIPFACAAGAGHESLAVRSTGDLLGATLAPPAPATVRLWAWVARPLDGLPPTVRALLLGIWLRPLYLYGSIAMPVFMGWLATTTDSLQVVALVAVAAAVRLELMGHATMGGLLSRRLALSAMVIPPLALFASTYALVEHLHPRVAPVIAAQAIEPLRASDPASRNLRASIELAQLRLSYPSGDEAALPDGAVLRLDEWMERRARGGAPPLTVDELAARLARAIERDNGLRLDPSRLIEGGTGGLRDVSSASVAVDIADARWRRALLFGLAAVTAGTALVANMVGSRAWQRSRRSLLGHRLIGVAFAAVLTGIGCVTWWMWTRPIPVPADLSLPTVPLGPWDLIVTWSVAHPWEVGGALSALMLGLLGLAWWRARWLPLVPERAVRLP